MGLFHHVLVYMENLHFALVHPASWVACSIIVSAPVPFGFRFIGTWLGLGLGGFGTKGFGTGLDN